jgi:hypothetical protein
MSDVKAMQVKAGALVHYPGGFKRVEQVDYLGDGRVQVVARRKWDDLAAGTVVLEVDEEQVWPWPLQLNSRDEAMDRFFAAYLAWRRDNPKIIEIVAPNVYCYRR